MFVISFTEMKQKDVPQRLYKWENFTSFIYKNYSLSAIRSISIYMQTFSIYPQNKLPGLSETVRDWYTLVFLSMGQGTSHVKSLTCICYGSFIFQTAAIIHWVDNILISRCHLQNILTDTM